MEDDNPANPDAVESSGGRLTGDLNAALILLHSVIFTFMRTVIPILLYHSISNDSAEGFRPWSVAPELFDAHMRYLRDEGYCALSISQMVRGLKQGILPPKPIAISFDDGLADFKTHALPILEKCAFSSTLYVVSGYINATSHWLFADGEGTRPMLTWEQLREIDRAGVEIGAHSHSHPQLDTLAIDEAWREIARSKWQIEEHLEHPIESFAYPYGYHTQGLRRLVQQAGFSSACAVKHAMSASDDDPFALSRIFINRNTSVAQLDQLLQGGRLPIAPRFEPIRTRMWRLVRRSLRHSQRLVERVGFQPVQVQSKSL